MTDHHLLAQTRAAAHDWPVGRRAGTVVGKNFRNQVGYLAARSLPLIYLNIPKSGCTSIKNLMHYLDSGGFLDDPLTIHARKDILLRAQSDVDEIFRRLKTDLVFTFVRHPLRRAYSCFNEKIYFQTKYSFPRFRLCLEQQYGAVFAGNPTLEEHRLNFLRFIRFAADTMNAANGVNPHWIPQTHLVNRSHRFRMLDFIGRVEKFDDHISTVLQLAGVNPDLKMPRMNEGLPPPYKYDDILNDEVLERGFSFYRNDFRNFGYEL